MELTVRDASRLLNTLEETIYRWIKQGSLPAYRLHNGFRFNRAELLEWANSRKLEVSPDLFKPAAGVAVPLFSDALRAGGIFYRVEGHDKPSVLRTLVGTMRIPNEVDRDLLLSALLTRATIDSTTIADGIAVPHVRNPVVLPVERPLASLHFLEQPVEFGATDGKPVFALFSLVSPTVRAHLSLISQLSFALRDAGFRAVLEPPGTPEEIETQLCRIETRLAQPAQPGDEGAEPDLSWPF